MYITYALRTDTKIYLHCLFCVVTHSIYGIASYLGSVAARIVSLESIL